MIRESNYTKPDLYQDGSTSTPVPVRDNKSPRANDLTAVMAFQYRANVLASGLARIWQALDRDQEQRSCLAP